MLPASPLLSKRFRSALGLLFCFFKVRTLGKRLVILIFFLPLPVVALEIPS